MDAQAIKADKYMDRFEIKQHLENVEYIMMVAPAPDQYKQTPLHFTIFLNTTDKLPEDIKEAILQKFCREHQINNPQEVLSQIMPVGFAISSNQETPMPMLLVKPADTKNIPNTPMHVIDFLADSDQFDEAKYKHLTGWSYSYNS